MVEFRRDTRYAWRWNIFVVQDTPYVKIGYLDKEYNNQYQFITEPITVILLDELEQITDKLKKLNEDSKAIS